MTSSIRALDLRSAKLMALRIDTLRMYARRHFPEWSWHQRERWVQAKVYLHGRKPTVDIGAQRVDVTVALRRLQAGLEIPYPMPRVLRFLVPRR